MSTDDYSIISETPIPIAASLLFLPEYLTQSRRYFYFIPTGGNPVKLVHRIEQHILDSLEGETFVYNRWRESVFE